jgi:thiol-disulfide isomerase/thioredoxin
MALAPGDPAPEVWGFRSDGELVRSDYAERRFTLVNFWATWCAPCKEEMPALQKLHESHADSGLQVIGVMNDHVSLDAMQRFADGLGVAYTVVKPHEESIQRWTEIRVLPMTFLIDAQGKVVRRYVGASAEQIEGLIYDVGAVLEGRPLGPLVIPADPATVTEADRVEDLQQEGQ